MSRNLDRKYSDSDGEVDFDFFDSPRDPSPSKSSARSRNDDAKEKKSIKSPSHQSASESDESDNALETKPNVKKIEAKLPVHTTSTSQDYSDNFESDSENEIVKSKSPRADDESPSKKQAWGNGKSSVHKSKSKSKDVTAHRSNSNVSPRAQKSNPRSRSVSDDSSVFSTSDSESDSDVTEVSPLGSPRKSEKDMYSMKELAKIGKPPRSPMHKETVSYGKSSKPKHAEKSSSESKLDKLLNADSDAMDLQLLMQAVMEMEHDREKRQRHQRRVLFTPPSKPKPQNKLNSTFSNEKVRSIDRENQRLMNRIVQMAREAEAVKRRKKRPAVARDPPKLTPSAVNRSKEQQRIDRENLAMLKRLQSAKPTKDLQRDKLLTSYNSHMIAGVAMSDSHPQAGGGKMRSPYSGASAGVTNRSTKTDPGGELGINGGAGGGAAKHRTRPSSAKSTASSVRPSSAKSSVSTASAARQHRYTRPKWEDGW